MSFRRFIQMFSTFLVMLVAMNATIWYGWAKEITDPYRNAGDLLRIGYINGYVSPRENSDDLPLRHIKVNEYKRQNIDVLTIGDSFSIGGGGGHNRHYQDYISSLCNLSVLNVPSNLFNGSKPETGPITTLAKIINSGYLEVIKPKYLILESVEREAIKRFTTNFSLKETISAEEVTKSFKDWQPNEEKIKNKNFSFNIINNGNWKFIANNIQYCFSDKARNSNVIISKLNRDFFTSTRADRLIFINDDYKTCGLSTPANIAEANKNLNYLSTVLEEKGVRLIFMPVVNKLNLYEPYLKQHKYQKSVFFEELRKLPKNYIFIDTKAILSKELEKGVQDIYYQDDSHWTWKASEAVFSSFDFTNKQF
ncbi:MAG: hypothetical protein PHN84_04295 [Desulfuromonadaceae bacterium]|nr:hypothetical protein [Desulfuromonadaceae bacterium]MDD2854287.1 hypothetical protein [Desulfuromonadaceae bacterium]